MTSRSFESSILSRRELLQAAAAGFLLSEQRLEAQDIKTGESWASGYNKFHEAVLSSSPIEADAIFLITREGRGSWQKSEIGKSGIAPSNEARSKLIESSANSKDKNMVIDFHNHPIQALIPHGLVTQKQAEMMRKGLSPLASTGPAMYDLTAYPLSWGGGDVGEVILTSGDLNPAARSHFKEAIIDPRGVWTYVPKFDHEFMKATLEISRGLKELDDKLNSSFKTYSQFRAQHLNKDSLEIIIAGFLKQNSGPNIQGLINSIDSITEKIMDLLDKNYRETCRSISDTSRAYLKASVEGKPLPLEELIRKFSQIGLIVTFTPHEQAEQSFDFLLT